jgi:phosphatidylserine/phosphatidylglycerophosphate/cardiolipin synthase-like enzyme
VFVSKEKTNAAILELNQWRDQAVAKHVINTPRILKDNKTIVPDEVRYVADLPEGKFNKNQNGLHVKFLDMINRATTSLEFSNPYILFPPDTKAAIKAAIDRGVKVKLNTNSVRTNDNHLMAMAWDVHKDEIIAMGIEVNEVKDGNFLHAKTVIIDADEVFIGSFNLDPRSKNLNLENGVFIKSKKMADTLLNYNRRLEKYFMTRAEKVVPTNVPLNQKMSNCVKKGLRKFVVGVMYRAL